MKQILLSIRMLLRFKVYTFVNFIGLAISLACVFTITRYIHQEYLQPIITQYFIDNKSEIWLLFLIAHSKR